MMIWSNDDDDVEFNVRCQADILGTTDLIWSWGFLWKGNLLVQMTELVGKDGDVV